jgi:hypothetical protein
MIIDGFNLLSGFKGNGMVYIIIECLNSSSSTLSYEINKFMSINGLSKLQYCAVENFCNTLFKCMNIMNIFLLL